MAVIPLNRRAVSITVTTDGKIWPDRPVSIGLRMSAFGQKRTLRKPRHDGRISLRWIGEIAEHESGRLVSQIEVADADLDQW